MKSSLETISLVAILIACLVTAALEHILLGADSFAPMQIHPFVAVTAVEISGELIHFSHLVMTLTTGKKLLDCLEHSSVNNRLMRILEDQNLCGVVLQPFFQLIGFAVGFEVYRIPAIELIAKHPSDGGNCPSVGLRQI